MDVDVDVGIDIDIDIDIDNCTNICIDTNIVININTYASTVNSVHACFYYDGQLLNIKGPATRRYQLQFNP